EQVQTLKLMGQSNAQIGQALGVCEGTVRYHLRRQGSTDGRKNRRRRLDALASAIDNWILAHYPSADIGDAEPPVHLRALHDWPRREHAYEGSHRSVVRYVRKRHPRLRLRCYARVQANEGSEPRLDRFGPAWVLRLLLGKVSLSALREIVGDVPDLQLLYRAVRGGGCKRRKKALVVLARIAHRWV